MMIEREGKAIKLLIVDDEPSMVEMLTRLMEPICARIDDTDNLEDCLKMASKEKYNLVILDLRLNGTGKNEAFEAIKELKRLHSGIVVVSGIVQEDLREEVLNAGADAFVPKGRTPMARSLLIAANVALLHLPQDSPKSDTFSQHLNMLAKMAAA